MSKMRVETVVFLYGGLLEKVWAYPRTLKGIEEANALAERLRKKYAGEIESEEVQIIQTPSSTEED